MNDDTWPAVPGEPSLDDPMEGRFRQDGPHPPPPGGILDSRGVRRWFRMLRWGVERDLYTYQQAWERRRGARVEHRGRSLLVLSSYDYLGLQGDPRIERAAIEATRACGTGAGGVRLLTGTTGLHVRLERLLAEFKGAEAAMTFGSGYAANIGVITALFDERDVVVADARAHRSLIDGCRAAGVQLRTFAHNDLDDLQRKLRDLPAARRSLIAVDGVYSMDGDLCPLPDLVSLKHEYGAFLLVDEAHAIGAVGAGGRGLHEHFGLASEEVDLWTGSLSKAIPANGGYVAASRDTIIYLQHGSAPYMFSAALSPGSAAAAAAALDIMRQEPGRAEGARRSAGILRSGLRDLGFDTGLSTTPLIPVILGSDETAYRWARALWDAGLFASAVVYPAVPRGAARLRLCATAAHSEDDIEVALGTFEHLRGRVEAERPAAVAP